MTVPTNQEIQTVFPIFDSVSFQTQGGQKAVYKAQKGTDTWALKIIPVEKDFNGTKLSSSDAVVIRARLEREVKILTVISNSYLPKVGPQNITEVKIGGETFLAYSEEYLEGSNLAALISKNHRPPASELKFLIKNILSAIDDLWAHQMVHRDIKPLNIMRVTETRFVLLDPGLALDLSASSLTAPHGAPGTLLYFSPEQIDLTKKRVLDFRSDVYALGATVYEYSTGQHPYFKSGMALPDLLRSILKDSTPILSTTRSDLPNEINLCIQNMMQKAPHLRIVKKIHEALELVN